MNINDINVDRFWAKVNKTDSCWLWTAAKDKDGYGRFKVKGTVQSAHRVLWTLSRGAIPDGLCVLHRCDMPPCANPEHLFLGTHLDNAKDRDVKGRKASTKGEKHGGSKLKEWQVVRIRRLLERGHMLQKDIANVFGIDRRTVSQINTGKRWPHIKEDTPWSF